MIEINLLPPELRKRKKKSYAVQLPKQKSLFIFLGSLVLLHFILICLTSANKRELGKLQSDWQQLTPKVVEIKNTKAQLERIAQKIPLIEGLFKRRVLWSKKLNQLSDLIIPGVWLDELSVKTEEGKVRGIPIKYLIIRGSAASRVKDEPALIGKFMQNLKENPSFSEDFSMIELGPMKKRQIEETEIMDFVLICQFKTEKIKAMAE